MDNLDITRQYLNAIERGSVQESVAFYSPDVIQQEFPNRLVPNGIERNLSALHEAALRGQKVILEQHYDVQSIVASGDTVILEVIWRGKLAVPVGSLKIGDEMRAHSAMFIEFRDGKIIAQRNYDCFEPW